MNRFAITETGTIVRVTEKGKITDETVLLRDFIAELRSNRESSGAEEKAARAAAKAERTAARLAKAEVALAKAQARLEKAQKVA